MWAEVMLSTSVGMELSSTWVVHTEDQQGEVGHPGVLRRG